MKKIVLIVCVLTTVTVFAQKGNDAAKFASTITQKDLKEQLTIIASAEFEGRETATEGQKKAAAYIESQFKKFGLLPGNGNSYKQVYPVYQDELKSASLKIYNANFAFNNHFSLMLNNAINGNVNINEVVFVSYGISDKERDDYKGIDVKGKWVLIIESDPADIDKDSLSSNFRKTFTKIGTATSKGAAGILIISRQFENTKRFMPPSIGNMYMKKQGGNNSSAPIISVSYQAASSILTKPINKYADLKNISIGKYASQLNIDVHKTTKTLESSNVVGIIEGTDKKEEYVVLTAHYDHLGKRDDGTIYYGADDDGSGTVTIIEMAEAFAKAKQKGYAPRRTIVFMTVSGEEKGLWGSDYYTQHPIYPLNKTSVNLNTDMIGRIDPKYKGDSLNYIYSIGEDKLSSDLMPISDSINQTFKIEIDRKFNDLKDPNRFYYRSDHFNFAKNGVPIIFYFNGVHKDYHRPSDTIEKINFDVMEKRARFIFTTAWVMANRNDMLKRDIPLVIPER